MCLLNNDYNLKGIGMQAKVSKYYHELKRIEIEARPSKYKQLKIKL